MHERPSDKDGDPPPGLQDQALRVLSFDLLLLGVLRVLCMTVSGKCVSGKCVFESTYLQVMN
jgi:hypothetical protein